MENEAIKEVFREVLEEERNKHWVDSQTHYEHHRFLKGWVWVFNIMKKSAIVAFATGIVAGIITVFWAGFKALVAIKGTMVG